MAATGARHARGSKDADAGVPGLNQRWPLDFVAYKFGSERKFRILAAIGERCPDNLSLNARSSILGERAARELDAPVQTYGKPACVANDSGTEFTSRAILKCAGQYDVAWHPSSP